MNFKNRNIALAIIFTFITFGIYGIYWFVVLVNDVKKATGDESLPGGGLAFFLTLITFNIYGWYLFYKMGKVMAEKQVSSSDNGALYLILAILGLLIVDYAIIQNELNRLSQEQTSPTNPSIESA